MYTCDEAYPPMKNPYIRRPPKDANGKRYRTSIVWEYQLTLTDYIEDTREAVHLWCVNNQRVILCTFIVLLTYAAYRFIKWYTYDEYRELAIAVRDNQQWLRRHEEGFMTGLAPVSVQDQVRDSLDMVVKYTALRNKRITQHGPSTKRDYSQRLKRVMNLRGYGGFFDITNPLLGDIGAMDQDDLEKLLQKHANRYTAEMDIEEDEKQVHRQEMHRAIAEYIDLHVPRPFSR